LILNLARSFHREILLCSVEFYLSDEILPSKAEFQAVMKFYFALPNARFVELKGAL